MESGKLKPMFKHNLPPHLTSLIGREREVATACQLLRHPEVRLLTLTGPGGVGKTRLAIQVAKALLDDFADGVTFISLASIGDPHLVISAIAHAFELREEGKRSLLDRLKLALQTTQQLLLIDNFEQVVEAATLLVDLLTACPDLKIMVTSREVLRIRGEHEFVVPLFVLPDLQRMAQVKAGLAAVLANNAAISLFVERAQAVKPDFQLNDENALAIAEICARLDGLPLAIELAAARIKLFSAQALLTQLSGQMGRSSLQLLTGGSRDLPARQRTLRDTIQWSYDLLTASEQQLFRQLSVFVGGFTLTAAEAVIRDWRLEIKDDALPISNYQSPHEASILDGIVSLLDKSLLQPMSPSGQTDDESRLTMLVTLREFAAEQLRRSEEAVAVQDAHAAYYLHLAEETAPKLFGPEQKTWLDRLELEHDNLRATLHWALKQDEAETALRLGGVLWRFWLLRGYLSEGWRWLEAILEFRRAVLDFEVADVDRSKIQNLKSKIAKALHGAGVLAMYQGDFRRAEAFCRESLALCRQRADKAGIAAALQGLAQVVMRMGQFTTARAMREESLAIYRELDDRWGIANALVYLGLTDWMQGDHMTAQPLLEEGLAYYRTVGDPQGIAQALQGLGWVALNRDDVAVARALIEESLSICRTSRDRAGMARSLTALGMVALQQDDPTRAQALLDEALPILIELGDKYHLAGCLGIMTALAVAMDQPLRAAQLYGVTQALMDTLGAAAPAFFLTNLERSLAAARAQLDEVSLTVALAEGRTMTPEQILTMPPLIPEQPSVEPVASTANYPAGLSEREVEVLRLLAQGLTNAQIAEHLIVSPYTINAHLRHIFNKLDVPSRAAATRYAIEHNLV